MELILNKNSEDGFYKETDLADIEFYSYEPVKDLVELTDLIHKEGYLNTVGKSGVHQGTYKIFSNFHNYCDISYMPKNIYDRCPTIKIDNLFYTHPHFMLIDAFRVYTDLLTSNFRLSKTFNRFTKLHFKNFVSQLEDLITFIGVKKINLVGFSIGALIAQHYTESNYDKVNKLVLIASVYKRSKTQIEIIKKRFKNGPFGQE